MNRQSSPGIGQWLTVIVTVGIFLFILYQLWQYGQVRDRLPAGLTIASINVGGQSLEQAAEIISNRYEDAPVILWYGEQRLEIAPADAEFQLDMDSMLRDADYQRSQQDFWAGFWGFLWDQPVEVESVDLYATHNRDALMDTLEAIALNLNAPAQPPQPVPTSLSFQYGTSGTEVDILSSLADVEAAFYRAETREARLQLHPIDPERPDIDLLARLIVNHVQEFEQEYGGVASIFIMDLTNGAEINYRADVAMSGMHLVKLPLAVTTYQVLTTSPTAEERTWLQETLLDVTSPGPNSLLQLFAAQTEGEADAYRGTDIVTDMMTRLGLTNTFIVTPYEQPVRTNRRTLETPANSVEIMDTIPDPTVQTTAEDMGLLLAMLYYCAQEDGGALRAVFPEQITQTECQQILALMQENNIDSLIEQGAPDGTVIAHRHGWINDTHGDAGIVYSAGGDYVVVVLLYRDTWLEWEVSSPLLADISRATYNYFNFDAPFVGTTP
ncbi:MAG: serine hydrolase [Chloroflexi bacterium]|nr:serine hydrolase [Chloroflexota bacterium]MBP8058624.1 serine hydrolase [Chloroflexota bacterium]